MRSHVQNLKALISRRWIQSDGHQIVNKISKNIKNEIFISNWLLEVFEFVNQGSTVSIKFVSQDGGFKLEDPKYSFKHMDVGNFNNPSIH